MAGARQTPVTRRRRSTSRLCLIAAAARRATWCKLPFGMREQPPAAIVAPPLTSGSSMKAARACPPISICLALGTPRPIYRRPANAWRRRGLALIDRRLFRRRSRSSPSAKSRLRLACNKSISSGRRLSNPRLYASLSSSVSLALAIRARSGAGLSTLAACACHSRRALRIWLGASLRWREVRRAILCPAGRSLRSLRLRSPQRHSGRTALRSITRRYRFCPDRFAGQKTLSRSCDAHAAAVRNVRFTSTPDGYGRRVCANTGHSPRTRRTSQIDPFLPFESVL